MEKVYNNDILMELWPWILFASLLVFSAGLLFANHHLGADRVDRWVFAHRDHLPIPFLIIGLLTRLVFRGVTPLPRQGGLEILGVLFIVLGESLRIWAVGIVGASTRSASTNAKRLVQEGPYAIIRNPIYAGNFLLCLGLACFTSSWEVLLACTVYFIVVYGRIIRAEERFLRATFGVLYDDFCRRVPRLVPRLDDSWQSLRAPFSFRELRKEYQTMTGILCAALLMHLCALRPWQGWLANPQGRRSTPLASLDGAAPSERPPRVRVMSLEPAHKGAQAGGTTSVVVPAPGPLVHPGSVNRRAVAGSSGRRLRRGSSVNPPE